MLTLRFLGLLSILQSSLAAEFPSNSSKRGLIYIPNSDFPEDDQVWIRSGSALTWYYNYEYYPSTVYENDTSLEFIPMLWGAPSSTSDTTFLNNVTAAIIGGNNITYAMGFNEPDGVASSGGSDIAPAEAAIYWIKEMEPLRKMGVSLGAPAVTGAESGFTWLSDFLVACDGGCTFDFIPIHWYGSFDGLASHIGDVMSTYPNKKIWVTEFALDNSTLNDTQNFFETACQYFDQNDNITHYSYFGSFRSSISNVGANVAMLTSNGSLTDIGSWYLGGISTGNIPTNDTVTTVRNSTFPLNPTYTMPALATHYSTATVVSGNNCLSMILFTLLGFLLLW